MIEKIKKTAKKYRLFYKVYAVYVDISIFAKKIKLLSYDCKHTTISSEVGVIEAQNNISSIRKASWPVMLRDLAQCQEYIDLSVIVPIYNVEKYLDICLQSLANQKTNYTFEIICVDDGSTDNSRKILEKYKSDTKFVIITQKNKGHSGARNTALPLVRGKYITFVDSDDFVSNNYIEELLNVANITNADIVQSSYEKCNSNSEKLFRYKYKTNIRRDFFEYVEIDGTPWGKIYKRELWDYVQFPEGMMFEDTIISNIIFRKCKVMAISNDTIYHYRIHGNNTIDKLKGDIRLLDAVWSILYSLDVSKRLGLENTIDYYAYLLLQCSTHLYYRIQTFPEYIQKSSFIIACDNIKQYRENLEDKDIYFQDIVLRRLDESFLKVNFELWKKCSMVYKSSHVIINKNYSYRRL
ncbi:glycosyltransferase family 2 protein [Clostridium sp. Marseille-P299]|uniref:glycosyltransferase family 2 protein n=1 Tax=Clostridium sp. Marseille-P299 TaxID=1805477 RepID=UPI0008373811|nr:glycosyltransferase family 2 protein [Clostridium sp. Marseille-P299]